MLQRKVDLKASDIMRDYKLTKPAGDTEGLEFMAKVESIVEDIIKEHVYNCAYVQTQSGSDRTDRGPRVTHWCEASCPEFVIGLDVDLADEERGYDYSGAFQARISDVEFTNVSFAVHSRIDKDVVIYEFRA